MFLTYVLCTAKIFIFSPIYNVSSGIKYISNNIGCCVILVLLQPSGSIPLSGFSNAQQGGSTMIQVKSSENSLNRIRAIVAGLFIINTLLFSGLCSKDVIDRRKNSLEKKKKVNLLLFHLKIDEGS